MADYERQLQGIVREYRRAGQEWPASTKDIARWAIRTRRFDLRALAIEKVLARDLAQAMREEYITDPKGRRVRAKHPAKVRHGGEQMMLWDDIRTAPRIHMEMAFQLRRNHIVGECRQVKADVYSYNDSHPHASPTHMVLDFTRDVEELEVLEGLEEIQEDKAYEEIEAVV